MIKISNLMDDMFDNVQRTGIGLAAIQIGVPKRIVVMDLSKEDEKKSPFYFINPELVWKSKSKATYEEGCLSIPNQFAKIQRPEKCKINFLDYNGKEKSIEADGLLQHVYNMKLILAEYYS